MNTRVKFDTHNVTSMAHHRNVRGYNSQHLPVNVKKRLRAFSETNLSHRVLEAVLTVGSIPIVSIIVVMSYAQIMSANFGTLFNISALSVIYLVGAIIIARQQRGLELMVHDASHHSWDRVNKSRNNTLANLLVAVPVFSYVQKYWESHKLHHAEFGTHNDPCKQRFASMGLGHIDVSTRPKLVYAILRWLPKYNREYYRQIGSQSLSIWGRFIAWHTLVLMMPTAILLSTLSSYSAIASAGIAVGAWMVFWMVPFLVVLPVLRSIGEAEEHDYSFVKSEFESTFTNHGVMHRLILHPKKDAYHIVHHMFPRIPECHHKKVHNLLMEEDDRYRNAMHRTRVMGEAA